MWWRRAVLPSLPWVVCFLSFFGARDWRALALTQAKKNFKRPRLCLVSCEKEPGNSERGLLYLYFGPFLANLCSRLGLDRSRSSGPLSAEREALCAVGVSCEADEDDRTTPRECSKCDKKGIRRLRPPQIRTLYTFRLPHIRTQRLTCGAIVACTCSDTRAHSRRNVEANTASRPVRVCGLRSRTPQL